MDEQLSARLETLQRQLDELMQAPVIELGEVADGEHARAEVPGVYLINVPDDPTRIVYAGRTESKSVRGRLRDHLSIATRSDLRGMLGEHTEYPREPRLYGGRWIAVHDRQARLSLEKFAIALLMPPFNRG